LNVLTQTALARARSFVGVRESGGNNRGPEVEAWLRRVGQPPGQAWCAAFAWCCVDDAFRRLLLPNPIRPCAGVVHLWDLLPAACQLDGPSPGCWAFHRDLDANGDPTSLGHMGFIDDVSPDGQGTYSIEGNTNSGGSRTGGGVWRHTPSLRPLGYWNLGFADYSVVAPICLPLSSDPEVIQ
jgi:hypothetical protein